MLWFKEMMNCRTWAAELMACLLTIRDSRDELKKYAESLEMKVNERTTELERAKRNSKAYSLPLQTRF